LRFSGSLAEGIALPAIPCSILAAEHKEVNKMGSEVPPAENLMREHGVLRRILLIYEEAIRRVNGAEPLPPGVIADSAGIIRRSIEDYHEKLEEEEIFPRFEKAGQLGDLAKVLSAQHQAGRRLTDSILKLSESEVPRPAEAGKEESAFMRQNYGGTPLFKWKSDTKQALLSAMQEFIRMYRPHADREDTVIFPALRSIVSPIEFDELRAKFEDRKKELFGKEDFEKTVQSVAAIENKLGIYELARFTPKV
jgi:hemerythrin-like domain-containing protein